MLGPALAAAGGAAAAPSVPLPSDWRSDEWLLSVGEERHLDELLLGALGAREGQLQPSDIRAAWAAGRRRARAALRARVRARLHRGCRDCRDCRGAAPRLGAAPCGPEPEPRDSIVSRLLLGLLLLHRAQVTDGLQLPGDWLGLACQALAPLVPAATRDAAVRRLEDYLPAPPGFFVLPSNPFPAPRRFRSPSTGISAPIFTSPGLPEPLVGSSAPNGWACWFTPLSGGAGAGRAGFAVPWVARITVKDNYVLAARLYPTGEAISPYFFRVREFVGGIYVARPEDPEDPEDPAADGAPPSIAVDRIERLFRGRTKGQDGLPARNDEDEMSRLVISRTALATRGGRDMGGIGAEWECPEDSMRYACEMLLLVL